MPETRTRFPFALPLIGVGLIIIGLIAGPVIRAMTTPQQMSRNIILNALPFILVFIGILLLYITLIVIVSRRLSGRIDPGTYKTIERVIIGGIVFGIFGMFQPWLFLWYQVGFIVLLLSTFAFILWSHVRPRQEQIDAHPAAVSEVVAK